MLAKQLLSQLSYVPIFWQRPQAPAATSVALGYSAHERGRPFGLANADAFGSVATTDLVGLGRLERPTSPLSGVRSNHLSYRPRAGADRQPLHDAAGDQRSRYPD